MPSFSLFTLYFGSLLLMSLATFSVYGFDKHRAREKGRRVPEARLHMLALLGGWPGALLGRKIFRHKTQKLGFTLITFAIVGLHGLLLAAWIWWSDLI